MAKRNNRRDRRSVSFLCDPDALVWLIAKAREQQCSLSAVIRQVVQEAQDRALASD